MLLHSFSAHPACWETWRDKPKGLGADATDGEEEMLSLTGPSRGYPYSTACENNARGGTHAEMSWNEAVLYLMYNVWDVLWFQLGDELGSDTKGSFRCQSCAFNINSIPDELLRRCKADSRWTGNVVAEQLCVSYSFFCPIYLPALSLFFFFLMS